MAAKGEDSLTQIQKYKALLASTRRKGGEEMTKKQKKKKAKKESDKFTSQTTDNEATGTSLHLTEVKMKTTVRETNNSKNDVDSITKGKAMTGRTAESTVTQGIEACSELAGSTMSSDKETMNEQLETTSAKVDEMPDSDQKEPEFEKSKKGRLSFRRKRKKSKQSNQESEITSQGEKTEVKNEPAENPTEDEDSTKVTMSSETQPNEAAMQNDENAENAVSTDVKEKKKGTADKDGKEKASRTKKFKRWASFSKQKKDGSTTEITSSETTNEANQQHDDLTLPQDSSDNITNVDGEGNEEENVNNEESKEHSPLSKEERRKRSVSFAETVKYHDDELCAEPETRKRSVSFGEETTVEPFDTVIADEEKIADKPKDKSDPEPEQTVKTQDENNSAVENQNNIESADNVKENAPLDIDNNDDNDFESLSDIEQKDSKTDDEYATAGDMTGEENDTDTKPKKKKKRFLRKLSSKNIKKKENKPLLKADISGPLELLDSEPAASEDVAEQSEPEEKSKENPSKRKKSVLGLKLPKALKKRKSTAGYKAVTGPEAEKEMKKDDEHQQENTDDKTETEPATEENTAQEFNDSTEKQEETTAIEEQQHTENIDRPEENSEPDGDKELSRDESVDNDNKEQIEQCETKVSELQEEQQTHDIPTQEQQENEPEQVSGQTTLQEQETDEITHEIQDEKTTEIIDDSENSKEDTAPEEIIERDEDLSPEEVNDDIQDSSLSVSEITLIEMGDESSLLAVPIPKESAQQDDIHELPSIQTPEVTQEQIDNVTEEQTEENSEENSEENEIPSTTEVKPIQTDSTSDADDSPNVSRQLSPEVCGTLRSFEMSVRTKAMVDSYILIDQQLEISQDFLNRVELMDNRRNRCFVM